MPDGTDTRHVRIDFDPQRPDAWLERVRAALRDPGGAPVLVDMAAVTYAGPAALRALNAALDEAEAAGREVWLDRAAAPVYKALQLARLAPRFRRVHHGRG